MGDKGVRPQFQNPAGMANSAMQAGDGGVNVADIIRRQRQTQAFNPAFGGGGALAGQYADLALSPREGQVPPPNYIPQGGSPMGGMMGSALNNDTGPNVADIIRRGRQTAPLSPFQTPMGGGPQPTAGPQLGRK